MKTFSSRQMRDIETIRFFIPSGMKHIPITLEDIQKFLDISERGEGKNEGKFATGSGVAALLQGKRWREWHMGAWEESVLEGSIPYYTLLFQNDPPLPVSVIEYMKKSMFKGQHAGIIDAVIEAGV